MAFTNKIFVPLLLLVYFFFNTAELITRENVGRNINSFASDISPVLTKNGDLMFFTRKKHAENYGIDKYEDIWYAVKSGDGNWQKAVNIGTPLNTIGPNSVFACSPSGDTVYLTNSYLGHSKHDKSPSFSIKTDSGWSFPTKMIIDDYYNNNDFASFSMSPDNKYLFLAIERDDSYGGLDIYVSFRKGPNLWSEPLNIGADINTRFDDTSPFLGPDNKSFYFASLGHNPHNDYDIYTSKRIDDTWRHWTIPKNLGPKVNTRKGEAGFYYTSETDYAYFTSTYNALGSWDIFRVPMSPEYKPDFTFLMSGLLLKEKYDIPFQDSTFYEINPNIEDKVELNEGKNKQISIPYGINFGILDKDDGMIYITDTFDITTYYIRGNLTNEGTLSRQQLLDKVFMIFFDYAKFDLSDSCKYQLDYLINMLVIFDDLKLKIVGHADNNGSETGNTRVSENRANTVRDYLLEQGITEEKLIIQYYGEHRPFAPNQTERQRQINRRVELNFVK